MCPRCSDAPSPWILWERLFLHIIYHTEINRRGVITFLSLSVVPRASVKRCCVTSSWWQAAWRCQLTGWCWRPVALTSVPCSQVHTHTHTHTHTHMHLCLLGVIFRCMYWNVLNCVCLQVIWVRARPIRWRSERWTDRLWESWSTTSTRLRSRSRRTTYRWERPVVHLFCLISSLTQKSTSHSPRILQKVDISSRQCRHDAA